MLLEGYRLEVFRPECNPSFQSLHCLAHLEQDVAEALPYLNASLGGDEYLHDPPAVTFKVHGKLITVHPRLIAVNALADEAEAERVVRWLQGEINQAWERRAEITPSTAGRTRPQVLALLRLLPRVSCRRCGLPTCLVFAVRLAEGSLAPADCPELTEASRTALETYLEGFDLD